MVSSLCYIALLGVFGRSSNSCFIPLGKYGYTGYQIKESTKNLKRARTSVKKYNYEIILAWNGK